MSVDQVAALLRVNRMTVTRFWDPAYTAPADQLRAKRYGGVWRVDTRDLAKFINRHTVTPQGQEPIVVTAAELPTFHTLEQVAERTLFPLRWIEEGCRKRQIPHLRAGRARLMTDAHIARMVELAEQTDVKNDEFAADRLAYATGRRSSRTPQRRAA